MINPALLLEMNGTSVLQAEVFSQEIGIQLVRCPDPDFYSCIWLLLGNSADWTGFIDDFGDFIPLDWC